MITGWFHTKTGKEFCNENFNVKLVFNSFKIKNYFSYKDPIPDDLKSFLVYKFTCASCSSSYIGDVVILKLGLRNISKRITSPIFLNIYTPPQHALTRIIPFALIIDKANSKFDLKIKEALHINWRKPNLNATIAFVPPRSFLSLFLVFFLRFSFTYYFHSR